jgi:hypothetical protein
VPLRLSELASNAHAETLAAVTLGAVVATVSGVVANMFEARARARERERAAAVLVGEAMAAMRTILEAAMRSMTVGERYGPVTRRMLIAARGELDLYERNRELLLDLRDAQLRADLHSLMLRLAMPLDGVIASLNDATEAHPNARDQGMEFLRETLTKIPPLLERLGRVAGRRFDNYEDVFRPGAVTEAEATLQAQPQARP